MAQRAYLLFGDGGQAIPDSLGNETNYRDNLWKSLVGAGWKPAPCI
jgi:hypothetical protein